MDRDWETRSTGPEKFVETERERWVGELEARGRPGAAAERGLLVGEVTEETLERRLPVEGS